MSGLSCLSSAFPMDTSTSASLISSTPLPHNGSEITASYDKEENSVDVSSGASNILYMSRLYSSLVETGSGHASVDAASQGDWSWVMSDSARESPASVYLSDLSDPDSHDVSSLPHQSPSRSPLGNPADTDVISECTAVEESVPANVTNSSAPETRARGVRKRRIPCTYPGCGRLFTSSYTLTVHTSTHKPKVKKVLACSSPGCGETFSR
jgi:hypothetical protein